MIFDITSSGHEKWFDIPSSGHEKWFDITSSGHEKWFVTSSNLCHSSFPASLLGSSLPNFLTSSSSSSSQFSKYLGYLLRLIGQIITLYLCARVVLSGTALLQFHLRNLYSRTAGLHFFATFHARVGSQQKIYCISVFEPSILLQRSAADSQI